MSLLATTAPVAVLVLAWDETAPAVRALVEATDQTGPTLDSVVVLVPAAAGEPIREEFLPLPAEAAPISLLREENIPAEAALPDEAASQPNEPTPTSEEAILPSLPQAPIAPATSPALATLAEEPTPLRVEPLAAAPASLAAVRVLRLSSFSLPELTALSHQALPQPIWQSSPSLPAAPYLGSELIVASDETENTAAPAQPEAAEISPRSIETPISALSSTLMAPQPEQPLPPSAPAYQLAEPLSPALDAEADLAPVLPEELVTTDDAALEALLAKTPTTDPADWADALASLRTPLPIEEPALATDLEDEAAYYAASVGEQSAAADHDLAELRPPSQPFEAPDLNFQVIQYARFAVPVALGQAPFTAIYAPAWPTWLAAQELRYRTRQPLVLHVATLAAGADESVATATSWRAELQRQALQRADLILAETPELTRRIRHDLGLPPELVRTVPAADAAAVAQALRTAQLRPTLNPS